MASWVVHFRIADGLIHQLEVDPISFIMGNMAPDSGVLNEDKTAFDPPSEISHFSTKDSLGIKEVHEEIFIQTYLTPNKIQQYNKTDLSFYLGYLTHLLTDKLWVKDIVYPSINTLKEYYEEGFQVWSEKIHSDWQYLDSVYLKEHEQMKAFQLYKECVSFKNVYIPFFSIDAFDKKQRALLAELNNSSKEIQTQDTYIQLEEIDWFVERTIKIVKHQLIRY